MGSMFKATDIYTISHSLQWRHNGRDGVSNHQPYSCLSNCLIRRRSKKTPKLRVTGLFVGNSPVTGKFPAQMASNAENVSISWRHLDRKDTRVQVHTYIFVKLTCHKIQPVTIFNKPSTHACWWMDANIRVLKCMRDELKCDSSYHQPKWQQFVLN